MHRAARPTSDTEPDAGERRAGHIHSSKPQGQLSGGLDVISGGFAQMSLPARANP